MSQLNDSQIVQEFSPFFQYLCNLVASTTCIIWYTVLTIDEEIEFMWSPGFTFVKVLYFIVRYLALILHSGTIFVFFGINIEGIQTMCPGIVWFVSIIGVITVACSNILFVQRVYAFYGCSKPLLWFLCSFFILNEIGVVIILALGIPRYQITPSPFPPPFPEIFGSCVVEKHSGIVAFVWFFELVFQTVAFVCVVARFAVLQFRAWKTDIPNPELYQVFLRDGIWMFCILFLCFILSGVYIRTEITLGLSFFFWSFAASSVCSTRLIFNLHHSAKKGRDFGASSLYTSQQVTQLCFRDPGSSSSDSEVAFQ